MDYDSEIKSANRRISNCDNQIANINKAIDKYHETLEVLKPIKGVESCDLLRTNIIDKIEELQIKIRNIEAHKIQLKSKINQLNNKKRQEMNG